ncbi:hypothetical protein D3C87_604070 [compost metagenome]
MTRNMVYILFLFLGTTLIIQSTISAQPYEKADKQKDSIEWAALWTFPKTREEQLECMLTTELQTKALLSLKERGYLKTGTENVYTMDPFHVTNMREVSGGFYEIDVVVNAHKVVNNKAEEKSEKYIINFRHDYNRGFIVKNVSEN